MDFFNVLRNYCFDVKIMPVKSEKTSAFVENSFLVSDSAHAPSYAAALKFPTGQRYKMEKAFRLEGTH